MAQTTIRLFHLACLYAILCYLGVELALTLRDLREQDLGRLQATFEPRALPSPASQIPFLGVTVALEQYNTPHDRQHALNRLRGAGFGWVRQRVDWSRIEPHPGDFQWAWTDRVLTEIAAAGLVPVIVLDGSPAWARDSLDRPPSGSSENDLPWRLAPPAAPETFARFAAAFARRYQDTVRFYQIWDEPNIAPHWGNRLIDPVGYARLLRAAAVAVRDADPNAVILAAALAPTQDRGHTAIDEGFFLQRLYAAGAAPYFDAVLVQPFGFGAAPADPRSRVDALNFRRAAWVRRVMVAAGDAQTPIWAVRFGWNRQVQDHWKTVSTADQLRLTEEAIRYAQANWPWLAAMGWPVDRPAAPPSDPMWGFSLVTPEGKEHALLSALTDAVQATTETEQSATRDLLYLRFALVLLACGFLLWWAGLKARTLPFRRWQALYLTWPLTAKLALWALLLTVYYLAVWPPLILLCWLTAAFLIAAEPISGLMIAAAALPFHFQHKELRLVGAVWAVPPAQAALLATLPALAQRAIHVRVWRIKSKLSAAYPVRLSSVAVRNAHCADLLVAAWIVISLLAAGNIWHWLGYFVGLWEFVLVPALFYTGIRLLAAEPCHQRAVLTALFAGGALAAVAGGLDWLLGGGVSADGVRRLMGITFSPNQTALYLLRTLLVGVGLLATGGLRRPALNAGCILVAAALLLTASRGALLFGLPAAALVIVVAAIRQERFRLGKRSAVLLTLVAGLTIVVGLEIVLLYGERLLNFETLRSRLLIWRDALALWVQYPLFGVGPGGFYWNFPAFLQPSPAANPNLLHPHSVWLEYATGWGVAGLLWLCALLFWLVSVSKRLLREPQAWYRIGFLAALGAALVHAQVDAFAALPELAAWNFAALALLATPHGTNG
ncbi:MAG: O-antigen ligase family protein [Caldilineaceae bacterium]|nr:O-antigen ligase family protein [Caldilineaceae bacterium]